MAVLSDQAATFGTFEKGAAAELESVCLHMLNSAAKGEGGGEEGDFLSDFRPPASSFPLCN